MIRNGARTTINTFGRTLGTPIGNGSPLLRTFQRGTPGTPAPRTPGTASSSNEPDGTLPEDPIPNLGPVDTDSDDSVQTQTLNGEVIQVRTKPTKKQVAPVGLYSRTDIPKLTGSDKSDFQAAFLTYVFTKHHKLSALESRTAVDLQHLMTLSCKLALLRDHLRRFDLEFVFNIVIPNPEDPTGPLHKSSTTLSLFESYWQIPLEVVLQSQMYYNVHVVSDHYALAMQLTYLLLSKNTEEGLWNKCLGEYENYPSAFQGGPLMLFLILQHIQDRSHQTIEHVRSLIETFKINKLTGEDITTAVEQLRAAYHCLRYASHTDRNYVPDDFPNTLLNVFQTTSVSEFNKTFYDIQQNIYRAADISGGPPKWPHPEKIFRLAVCQYHRLCKCQVWNVSKDHKTSAFRTEHQHPGKKLPAGRSCFNCGSPDHYVGDCPKPKDSDRIAKARAALNSSRNNGKNPRSGKSKSSSNPPPPTVPAGFRLIKQSDGKPYKLNKKNEWVLDVKAARKMDTDLQNFLPPDDSSSARMDAIRMALSRFAC